MLAAEEVFSSNFVHILTFFIGLRSTYVPTDYRCWSYIEKIEGKQDTTYGWLWRQTNHCPRGKVIFYYKTLPVLKQENINFLFKWNFWFHDYFQLTKFCTFNKLLFTWNIVLETSFNVGKSILHWMMWFDISIIIKLQPHYQHTLW